MIEKLIEYLSIFIAVLIVLPLHEFAHALSAVKCGDNTPKLYGRYTLNPLAHFDVTGLVLFVFTGFGWAKPVPINPYNFRKYKLGCFFTSIAGVLSNYILAFIAYPIVILALTYIPQTGNFYLIAGQTLINIYYFSLSFCVFNLLPIYPLDGFRVLDVFCNKNNKIYLFLRNYGRFILIGLLIFSLISDITGIYALDFLGNGISYVVNVISKPITASWCLIL